MGFGLDRNLCQVRGDVPVETVLLGHARGTGEPNPRKRLLLRTGGRRRRRDGVRPAGRIVALSETASVHRGKILRVVVDVVLSWEPRCDVLGLSRGVLVVLWVDGGVTRLRAHVSG